MMRPLPCSRGIAITAWVTGSGPEPVGIELRRSSSRLAHIRPSAVQDTARCCRPPERLFRRCLTVAECAAGVRATTKYFRSASYAIRLLELYGRSAILLLPRPGERYCRIRKTERKSSGETIRDEIIGEPSSCISSRGLGAGIPDSRSGVVRAQHRHVGLPSASWRWRFIPMVPVVRILVRVVGGRCSVMVGTKRTCTAAIRGPRPIIGWS